MSLVAYVAIAALVALSIGLALAALVLKRARDASSGTAEHIAYGLLFIIARLEGKSLEKGTGGETPDRKWILDTFAECVQAAKTPDKRLG